MSKIFAPGKARKFHARLLNFYEEFEEFQQGQSYAWEHATPAWKETPRGQRCSDFIYALEDVAGGIFEAMRTLEDGINQFED